MAGNSGERKSPGRPFKPGQSGNPDGRPKGAAGLAAYLRKLTRNGRDGADRLAAIAMGEVTRVRHVVTKDGIQQVEEPPSFAESIAAEKVLLDRMHGTAQKFIEVTGAGGGPLMTVLANLGHASDDDLKALEGILQRTLHGGGDAGGGEGGEGAEN
ncbi:MAG TPA: DUF5681 domain-containing protein [Archangium sp.]|nr:DUF5681 domain-containing protein [Archangium sp.]